jgi:toxin-antitoxin system PIN domain toxin
MKTTLLPDVNVWLALGFRSHQHHDQAVAWYERVDEDASILFCRMTQQGFLRLATHPGATGNAVPLPAAWGLYDRYFEDDRIGFAHEHAAIEAYWRNLTRAGRFSPKVWNDAYLAAFALAGGYEIVTFDRGFEQFRLERCMILG